MAAKNARKQKRKEDRMSTKQNNHKSWLEHQKLRKLGKNMLTKDVEDFDGDVMVKNKSKDVLKPDILSKSLKKNMKELKTKRTKFEEYLELESKVPSAEDDLEMERRLAKKLKVKNGKLGNDDDDINFLFGDDVDQEHDEQLDKIGCVKINKDKKKKIKTKNVEDFDGDAMVKKKSEDVLKPDILSKSLKKNMKELKTKRTKFEEYLELESKVPSAEDDLEMERRLAKKLKVKNGKLGNDDDDINFLFGDDVDQEYDEQLDKIGCVKINKDKKKKIKTKKTLKQENEVCHAKPKVISVMENEIETHDDLGEDGEVEVSEADLKIRNETKVVKKKEKKVKENAKSDNVNVEAYIVPQLRACSNIDSNDNLLIRRRIKGLLNKLSKSKVEAITGEIFAVFQSVARSVAFQIVAEEVLASCAEVTRDNEQHLAVFAAFVAGLTCMVGVDFGAKLLESLAKSFEKEYTKEDNHLSLRTLTLLLSYLYLSGVCSSDLIYDFLMMLTKQMLEIDVDTIWTVLKCCGMKLRSDDPATMKEFILGVQSRVTEMKASKDYQPNATSRRAILLVSMLEIISDIKNNKKRKEELTQYTGVKKWLQKLRVDDFAIRGIKWITLVDPEKKGQWWLTGDLASSTDNVELIANSIDKEVLEAQKMLELAASQRMNTDIRKAIFCVIMSGEDYVDAFEKLMRLDLQGKQDREIMRVLLECCLQEKIFNKYYTALAIKLCRHEKNHKFTLQYCVWDQFKELDTMPLVRSFHLAKFLAEMLASYTLSMAVIKVVDLGDMSQLSPKRIMHFRMLFDAVFGHPDNVVWNIFTRIAVTPELESLRSGIEFFIIKHVLPSNNNAKHKFKLAKKALNNAEGVLM